VKILDMLKEGTIIAELNATDKKGVLEELTAPLALASGIDYEELVRVLLERERLGNTGIGGGIELVYFGIQE
jgi:PTS system nitrogen regulatory IIA component